ncbi:DUF5606 domain-containing protein [Pontibacter sp. G13]|uniref:DUF5606 family protein n=1 Tax=Pontibacter sp. G13 TaxID=3074898 RepID=UPI00288A1913|nr:DUF5606 domain-containing protein [Pontibacter sp. G13]WNJ19437.1 DUF5606 domain-containing protein [Pontibacter sp. G13]
MAFEQGKIGNVTRFERDKIKDMDIEIKDVVALTGAPGLYRVVKADDRAIVVESMDEAKRRQLVKGNMMVSKVVDISIYTETDSEPLVNVFKAIQDKYGEELPVTKKSNKDQLMGFLGDVLPDFDGERVYPSNVKKLISWYKILLAYGVKFELPEEEGEAEAAESTEEAS